MKSLVIILSLISQIALGQNTIAFRKSGVIFTKNYQYHSFKNFKRFTPSIQEITELEQLLKDYEEIRAVERLSGYYRQYLGYYNTLNKRVIIVNFLRKKDAEEINMDRNKNHPWRTQWMQVHDGGNRYWKIKYNPDSKKFYEMTVNGVS